MAVQKWSKTFWVDWGERVGSTLVYGLIAFVVTFDAFDREHVMVLLPVVVLPTVLAALKGIGANLASPGSGASLIPATPGPYEVIPEPVAGPETDADSGAGGRFTDPTEGPYK